MSKYVGYLKYVLEHKKNVFKCCWKKKLYLQAFTHDLSKFSLSEFKPYAENFYGEKRCSTCKNFMNCEFNKTDEGYLQKSEECRKYSHKDFDAAWEHHQIHNKHHWDYWTYDLDKYYTEPCISLAECRLDTPRPMPVKYIREMIADWEAMGIKFGDTAQSFYLRNYKKIKLERETRTCLEYNLGLMQDLNAAYCECNWEVNGPIIEIVEEYSKTEYGTKVLRDELFTKIDVKYGIVTYELLTK